MKKVIKKRLYYGALLAFTVLFLTSCSTQPSFGPTTKGALLGTAIGSGLGAVIGNQTGRSGEGVAIGAGFGALTGGLIGRAMEPDTGSSPYYGGSAYGRYDRSYEERLNQREQELLERERAIERREQGLRERKDYLY